jgi:hypothetical protein
MIKTATVLGVSRATVSKVMLAYTNHGKTTSVTRSSAQKSTVTERDCHTLSRTFKKSQNYCSTGDRTAELNINLEGPVSTKIVQCEIHKPNIYSRVATAKCLITENNAQMHKQCCHEHKRWKHVCDMVR